MREAAELDAAVAAGIGPRLVGGEPDGVGPARAVGGVRTLVGDGEADLDLAAVDCLRRRDDAAGYQVGQRLRFDKDRLRDDVERFEARLQRLSRQRGAP